MYDAVCLAVRRVRAIRFLIGCWTRSTQIESNESTFKAQKEARRLCSLSTYIAFHYYSI